MAAAGDLEVAISGDFFMATDIPELGYFTLSELTGLRGPLGLRVERDLSFRPCRLSDVKSRVKAA